MSPFAENMGVDKGLGWRASSVSLQEPFEAASLTPRRCIIPTLYPFAHLNSLPHDFSQTATTVRTLLIDLHPGPEVNCL